MNGVTTSRSEQIDELRNLLQNCSPKMQEAICLRLEQEKQKRLRSQSPARVPKLRGAQQVLFDTRNRETVVAGPAETGKTYGCLEYVHWLLQTYPRAQGVMVRKTYAALVASALVTYKRIIANDPLVKAYGGEKPEWFQYANGSRLWVTGLDNAGKVLSSERDFFYVNQAEELTEEEWEFLTMRATGRGAVMPYTRVFADCNPGPPMHWIKTRANVTILESRHQDNPTLYTESGELTAQGVRTMEVLDALTGVRYQRYRLGKWVQAEGTVYEQYDRAIHLIDPFKIPANWVRMRSIDFGFTNPFVCQWWAIDPDGRMYLYRELYRTQRIVKDHAAEIKRLSEGERYLTTVADHDSEDRATLRELGVDTAAAYKDVKRGIEAVQDRLKAAGDGKPRLFIMRGALVDADPELLAKKKPTCTEQEFEVYVWAKDRNGKPNKEEPVKEFDHGMDTMRYATAYADELSRRTIRVMKW